MNLVFCPCGALGATALEAMKLEHVKQSVNGCVTCSRKWSDHTDVERG
jgi:hypothetical protein